MLFVVFFRAIVYYPAVDALFSSRCAALLCVLLFIQQTLF